MVCVKQIGPHRVNQMGKTQFKPLAERHGWETAGQQHGMCESAFSVLHRVSVNYMLDLITQSVVIKCPSYTPTQRGGGALCND
jgi:hypothetical protein